MMWFELLALGAALFGAGVATGGLICHLIVRDTEPVQSLDLDAPREVEMLPEWREQELRGEITRLTIDAASEQREHARWQELALDADERATELRAQVNGLRRFLRAHGFTGEEVRKWLKASLARR